MAPIPASINLSWISNYSNGCHRVCYSVDDPQGPFTCVTVNCTPGTGQSCSTSIAISVDNETCDQVTYYGYIQACCEDISSTNGRIPWQITFVPNPSCKSVNFLCNNTTVASVAVSTSGSGYDPGSPPTVSIVGGGGAGATASAVVGNGGIKTSSISNVGSGMTDGTYTGVLANTVTGTGSGATFDVVISGGQILSATRVGYGTGYAIGDTVNFPTITGGGGTELVAVSTVNTSEIQSITVTSPGGGYSSIPSALIAPSPGYGGFPQVDAVLGPVALDPCAAFALGSVCGNVDAGTTLDIQAGESFDICYTGGIAGVPGTVPQSYGQSESGLCCYDCINVQITQPGNAGNTTIFYQDCTTNAIVQAAVLAGTGVTYCAKRNSWGSLSPDTIFTQGSVCP